MSKFLLIIFFKVGFICSPIFSFTHLQKPIEGYVKMDHGSLYYQEIGKGTPIIILHGGPGLDHGYLLPQLNQLAKEHRVIFYDQRGSGKSIEDFDEKYINLIQFAEDLELLRSSLGLEKFILMTHSWGGLIGIQYALDHQEYLLGMILLSPCPVDYRGQKAFLDEYSLRIKNIENEIAAFFSFEDFKKLNSLEISNLFRKLFSIYFYRSSNAKDLSLEFTSLSAQCGYKVMQEMSKSAWLQPDCNLFPILKQLDIPTLILHGKQDVVPLWTAEEIKDALSSAKLVTLEECGHFPYIEQPIEFFKEVNQFLREIDENSLQTERKNGMSSRKQ